MTLHLASIRNVSLLLAFLLIVDAVQAQTASLDIISYDAQIEPDISGKTVRGKVTLRFNALINGLTRIQLNSGSLEIAVVREDKNALKFEKKDNLLNIDLSRPAKLNESRKIEIEYHGAPRFGIRFFPELKQIYTVFSTGQWLPSVDAPDDRATFRLNLILPKDLKAVGNGRLIKQISLPNGKNSYLWEQKTPIPTYIFGFAAGDFREVVFSHRGVKFRYLAPPQFSEAEIKQIFRDTTDMLDFFTDKAGIKYIDQTYTQVLATGGVQQEMSSFAAMNNEYGKGVLENERENWLVAHELAHQWWGNMVTNRNWNHFWLNEGLATFMVAAYKEHRFGREEYLKEIGKLRARYERVRDAGKDKSIIFPDWNNPAPEDRSIVYNKGGYVFHLLREEIGDAAFWGGIKEYTRQNWGKSVTTPDLKRALEKASRRNLSSFFNKWVFNVK